jgi:hypothetical protein
MSCPHVCGASREGGQDVRWGLTSCPHARGVMRQVAFVLCPHECGPPGGPHAGPDGACLHKGAPSLTRVRSSVGNLCTLL